jgi:hypothetical protein
MDCQWKRVRIISRFGKLVVCGNTLSAGPLIYTHEDQGAESRIFSLVDCAIFRFFYPRTSRKRRDCPPAIVHFQAVGDTVSNGISTVTHMVLVPC